jgi:hypothetical protein
MIKTPWIRSAHHAKLNTDSLQAAFRFDKQSAGLGEISVQGIPWGGTTITGIHFPESDEVLEPRDAYLRGNDAIAEYALTKNEIHVEVYRRRLQLLIADCECPGFETRVAIRTDLLDTHPIVNASTCVADAEVQPLTLDNGSPAGAAWLIRPTDKPWSYIEMVPSTDFQSVAQSSDGNSTSIQYPFFGQHLEKGVIRISRVRGLFVERSRDLQLATTALQNLQNEAPPLAT